MARVYSCKFKSTLTGETVTIEAEGGTRTAAARRARRNLVESAHGKKHYPWALVSADFVKPGVR